MSYAIKLMNAGFVFLFFVALTVIAFAGDKYVGKDIPSEWIVEKNLKRVAICKNHKIHGKRWDGNCKCYIIQFSCDSKDGTR